MASNSTGYTIGFATAVCVLCGIGVASANVALSERQGENKKLDQQKQVLTVAGLVQPGEQLSPDEVKKRFAENIRPEVVDLKSGATAKGVDPAGFDQRRAAKDEATSSVPGDNMAKVMRVPNNALVYHVVKNGQTDTLILPIEGYGLWGFLYGYMALDKDANTVKGITYYQHAETPGLGGEVDNPKWKKDWVGRKIYDDKGAVAVRLIKGDSPDPKAAPFEVDGLSGATITSNGVTNMMRFWFDKDGFKQFLTRFKSAPKPPEGGK